MSRRAATIQQPARRSAAAPGSGWARALRTLAAWFAGLLAGLGAVEVVKAIVLVAGHRAHAASTLAEGVGYLLAGTVLWRRLGIAVAELPLTLAIAGLAILRHVAPLVLLAGVPALVVPGAAHLTRLWIDVAAVAVVAVERSYATWWRNRRRSGRRTAG
jgi:hypothetical protein